MGHSVRRSPSRGARERKHLAKTPDERSRGSGTTTAGYFGATLCSLNSSRASARASLPKRTSAMLAPNRPGTVGRSFRRPTTDRGRMGSSKAPLPRAAPRTLFALLIVLDGAVAMREPLPVSTWYALEQREWRIASTKHANSYLFRVDGGAGICTPATVGACCGDSATRVVVPQA